MSLMRPLLHELYSDERVLRLMLLRKTDPEILHTGRNESIF